MLKVRQTFLTSSNFIGGALNEIFNFLDFLRQKNPRAALNLEIRWVHSNFFFSPGGSLGIRSNTYSFHDQFLIIYKVEKSQEYRCEQKKGKISFYNFIYWCSKNYWKKKKISHFWVISTKFSVGLLYFNFLTSN